MTVIPKSCIEATVLIEFLMQFTNCEVVGKKPKCLLINALALITCESNTLLREMRRTSIVCARLNVAISSLESVEIAEKLGRVPL
jgi:hypothetical protein